MFADNFEWYKSTTHWLKLLWYYRILKNNVWFDLGQYYKDHALMLKKGFSDDEIRTFLLKGNYSFFYHLIKSVLL